MKLLTDKARRNFELNIKSTESNKRYSVSEILTGAKYGTDAFGWFVAGIAVPLILTFFVAYIGHHIKGTESIFFSKFLHVGAFFSGMGFLIVALFREKADNKGVNTRIIVICLLSAIGATSTILMNPFTTFSEKVTNVQFITTDQKKCPYSVLYVTKNMLQYTYCADYQSDNIYSTTNRIFNSSRDYKEVDVVLVVNNFLGTTGVAGVKFIERGNYSRQ